MAVGWMGARFGLRRRHELVRLAGLIDWKRFDEAFGGRYAEKERPGLPTRLMVRLRLRPFRHKRVSEAVWGASIISPRPSESRRPDLIIVNSHRHGKHKLYRSRRYNFATPNTLKRRDHL